MRRLLLILLLLFLVIFTDCQAESFPNAKEVEIKISSALVHLKNRETGEGIQSILDALLLTAPHSNFPKEVETNISQAREHLTNGFPNAEAHRLIRKTYGRIEPGFDKAVPGKPKQVEPSNIPPIAEMIKNKMLTAQEEIKKGNADKVVKLLLECLLVLTKSA
jgi:hypothetical protein